MRLLALAVALLIGSVSIGKADNPPPTPYYLVITAMAVGSGGPVGNAVITSLGVRSQEACQSGAQAINNGAKTPPFVQVAAYCVPQQ
jgi:hypothetical protein